MKKLIFILIILPLYISAQSPGCSFVPYPEMLNINNYTNRVQTITDQNEPLVFNVKFQGMHGSGGVDIHNINEERFLRMIVTLNIHYNPFNIFFKYRGYSMVEDDNYVNIGGSGQHTTDEMVQYVRDLGFYDETAIIIFVNHGSSSGGYRDVYCSTTFQDTGDANFYSYMVPHEMGHTLGLLHIQSRGINSDTPITTNLPSCMYNPNNTFSPQMIKPIMPTQQTNPQIENVTRNHFNSDGSINTNFNADIAGDLVVDTQACFNGFTNNYCKNLNGFPFTDWTLWSEHPNVTDFVGETYKCTAVESHNIMGQGVPTTFTVGQGARMRQHIISNAVAVFNQRLNLQENGNADVSVLYEPYSVSTYPGEIVTVHNNSSGTNAIVCRSIQVQHKFQPGFDYTFPENNGTDPVSVSKTTFPVPPVRLHTYDYPVTIAQLSPTITNLTTNTGIAHVYCTRGLLCHEEPFTHGRIVSTTDLLNMNVTIEELDAIRVKDPQLYDSLMSAYYYKLQKETDSGIKVEETFYKP